MNGNPNNWKMWKGITPQNIEISSFLIFLLILILILFEPGFRNAFLLLFLENFNYESIGIIFITLIAIFGSCISVYYVFSNKKATPTKKLIMILSVGIIYLYSSLALISYALNKINDFSIESIAYFAPLVLGLVFGSLFFFFFLLNIYEEDFATKKSFKNKKMEIILGIFVFLTLFFISKFLLHNVWNITFSLCFNYGLLVNELVNKIFVKKEKL